jgi:hypothetical protein
MDQIVADILNSSGGGEIPFVVAPQFKRPYELKDIMKVAIHVHLDEHKQPSQALEQLQSFLARHALAHMKLTEQGMPADVVCSAAIKCMIPPEEKIASFKCKPEPGSTNNKVPPTRDDDPVAYAQALLWPSNFWDFAASYEHVCEYARWLSKTPYLNPPEDAKWTPDYSYVLAPICFAWNLVGWIQDHEQRTADDFVPPDALDRKLIDRLFDAQKALERPPEIFENVQEFLAQSILPYGVYLTSHRFLIADESFKPSGASLLQRYTDEERVQWFQQECSPETGQKHPRYKDAYEMVTIDLLFAGSFLNTQSVFHQYILKWVDWVDEERVKHLLEKKTFVHRPIRPVMCHLGGEYWMVHARVPRVPEDASYSRVLAIYCPRGFREAFMTWRYVVRTYFDNQLETGEMVEFPSDNA